MLRIELVLLQTNIKREYGSDRADLCQTFRASVLHQSPCTSSPVLDCFFSIFASLTYAVFNETVSIITVNIEIIKLARTHNL